MLERQYELVVDALVYDGMILRYLFIYLGVGLDWRKPDKGIALQCRTLIVRYLGA